MAKSKHKQALGGNRQIPGTANPNQQNIVEMSPSTEVPQGPAAVESVPSSDSSLALNQQQQHDSNMNQDSAVSPSSLSANANVNATPSPPVVTLTNFSTTNQPTTGSHPAANNSITASTTTTTNTMTNNVNTSPSNHSMSPSVSSTFHHSHLNPSSIGGGAHPHPQLSSSISSSSMHMLASSISTDRLSNVQLNPSLLDDDEIGHAIPTPECLPQSRKHSIVQSKLATPTLSSS